MKKRSSLIEAALNADTSQVYGSDKNYSPNDVSCGMALQNQLAQEFVKQAFTQNGVGFKAFLLAYENQGLNPATSGNDKPGESAEKSSPLEGLKGKLGSVLEGLFGGDDTPSTPQKALTQINFLNNVKARVWIPTLDIDVPKPRIYKAANGSAAIQDFQLYQICNITDEDLLQSLPSPGSLIMVDYENRQMRAGLTLVHPICTEATFARLIMAEFGGKEVDIEEYFESVEAAEAAFDTPKGDPPAPGNSEQLLTIDKDKIYPYNSDITEYDIIVFYPGLDQGKNTGQRQATILTAIEKHIQRDLPSDKLFIVPHKAWKDYGQVAKSIDSFKEQYGATIRSISLGFWSGGASGGTSALNSGIQFTKVVAADPFAKGGLDELNASRWNPASLVMFYRYKNWIPRQELEDLERYTDAIASAGGTLVEYTEAPYTGNTNYNHYDIMVHALKELT